MSSSEFREACDRDNQPISCGRIMEEAVLVVDWPWSVGGEVGEVRLREVEGIPIGKSGDALYYSIYTTKYTKVWLQVCNDELAIFFNALVPWIRTPISRLFSIQPWPGWHAAHTCWYRPLQLSSGFVEIPRLDRLAGTQDQIRHVWQ